MIANVIDNLSEMIIGQSLCSYSSKINSLLHVGLVGGVMFFYIFLSLTVFGIYELGILEQILPLQHETIRI